MNEDQLEEMYPESYRVQANDEILTIEEGI